MRTAFSGRTCCSVDTLWSLSASLMMSTRRSSAIATKNLRKLSTWRSWPRYLSLPSFVTPFTRKSTFSPKSSRTSSSVASVSSRVSWRSAAMIVSRSMPSFAQFCATASTCIKYGSPLLRSCPSCFVYAKSYADCTSCLSASLSGCVMRGSRVSIEI